MGKACCLYKPTSFRVCFCFIALSPFVGLFFPPLKCKLDECRGFACTLSMDVSQVHRAVPGMSSVLKYLGNCIEPSFM